MNIIDAVATIIGVDPAKVPRLIAENGRLEIECSQMGRKQDMPILEVPNMLRVGRHLWLVTWKGPEDFTSIPLTQQGT